MNNKRILACIAILALLMSMFAGCGNTTTDVSENAAESSSEQAIATTDEVVADTEDDVIADSAEDAEVVSDAEEIVFGSITYPLETEGETLTYWLPWMNVLGMLYSSYLDHPAYAAAEEKTGVKVEYISCAQEQAATEFNLMAASGSTYDIISGAVNYYNGGASAAIEDGIILELTDVMAEYLPDYYREFVTNENWVKYATTDDGQIGAVYSFNCVELGLSSGPFVRQDWLDELGLDTPVTVEDYHDVLTAFKSEYNCTDAFMLSANLKDNLSYAFGTTSFDVEDASSPAFYLEDGKVVSVFTSENYKNYISTLAQWYAEGLIGQDFLNRPSDMTQNENTAVILGDNAGIWNTVMKNLEDYPNQAVNPAFACAAIPDALPADGSKLTFYSTDPGSSGNASIGGTSDNWELALKWINFWSTEEGLLIARYGVEDVSYTVENGEPVYTDVIYNNPNGFIFQLARIMYCAASVPTYGDPRIVRDNVYSENVIGCTAIWESAYESGESYISSSVTMTVEESDEFYEKYTDIGTYAQTELLRFVVGDYTMDKWGEFVSKCEEMGIDECTEIYQQAYDRYAAR